MNNPKKLVPEGRLQRKALDPNFYISKFQFIGFILFLQQNNQYLLY